MKSSFKKILSGLLLFAGFMPVAFALFFLLKQQMIRHEMKESMEQKLLQTITLDENEVHWVKPGKEILIDGKMFDIKSFTSENGRYQFTGLFDHEETALINSLKNNFKKSDGRSHLLLVAFFYWLQSVNSADNHELICVDHNHESNPDLICIHISSPFQSIPTPPPQA